MLMKIFVIGINGIGMQGLAKIALDQGYSVTGYDDDKIQRSFMIKAGVVYCDEISQDIDLIVYSSAISENHKLRKNNIKQVNRTDFLINYLNFNPKKILIAGAHGKTTTCAMLAHILKKKSYLLGSILKGENYAAHHELDDYTVIETDESDGSFLKWAFAFDAYKILLNFAYEHMEYFQTEEKCRNDYKNFVLANIVNSKIIMHIDAKKNLNIPDHENIITYGEIDADYVCSDIEYLPNSLQFKIRSKFDKYDDQSHDFYNHSFEIPLFGAYNAWNFTAIYALLKECGIDKNIDIQNAMKDFPGILKRMEIIKKNENFTLYLDYGHHPKEIESVLKSFIKHNKKKPLVVIEPHKFSRLEYTWNLWPDILKDFDVLIADIYSAGQVSSLTVEDFIEYLKKNQVNVKYLKSVDELVLNQDIIIFSAGKVSKYLSGF